MYYFEHSKFGKFEGSGCKFPLQTCARCIRSLFTTRVTPLTTFSFKSKAQNHYVKCQLFGCFLWMIVDILHERLGDLKCIAIVTQHLRTDRFFYANPKKNFLANPKKFLSFLTSNFLTGRRMVFTVLDSA